MSLPAREVGAVSGAVWRRGQGSLFAAFVSAVIVSACASACGRVDYLPLQPFDSPNLDASLPDGTVRSDGGVTMPDGATGFDGAMLEGGTVSSDASSSSDGQQGSPDSQMTVEPRGNECAFTSTPLCPNGSTIAINNATGSSGSFGSGTNSSGNLLSGSCGGADAEERSYPVVPSVDATYRFYVTNATVDTVLYVLDGACNEEGEIECVRPRLGADPELTISLTAGRSMTIVVDGLDGRCGTFRLNWESVP